MNAEEMRLINSLKKELQEARTKIEYYESLLRKNGISFTDPEKQPQNMIIPQTITNEHVRLFMSVFQGRKEFYAKRTRYGTYLRPCWNRYNHSGICPKQTNSQFPCKDCRFQNFRKLNNEIVLKHLKGEDPDCTDVIGIYPITAENTCWFLVYDFDDHNHSGIYENAVHNDAVTGKSTSFIAEVKTLSAICSHFGVPHLIERSRSGYGAHLWIFFDQPIPCVDARRFGNLLLTQGMNVFNVSDFKTYDRMMPMQDTLEANQAGNLIALPLQGMAVRQGNSVFTDQNFNAYPDQWAVLKNLNRYPALQVNQKLREWNASDPYGESTGLFDEDGDPTRPWDQDQTSFYKSDVSEKLEIIEANGIYVRKQNTNARMRNRIRRIALYKNPEYFKMIRRNNEVSHLKNPYYIYCGREYKEYIFLPRGCSEALLKSLNEADIPYTLNNRQAEGSPLKVQFDGELKENQKKAIQSLKDQNVGIISAATAFGKTVVGASLIAERKVNTLILVNRSEIMDGWYETLEEFLDIDMPLPTYKTKTGIVKTRKSVIGRIGSGKSEANGHIDIAMIQSLVSSKEIKPEYASLIKEYGMVIVDECHHVAGDEYQEVLSAVMAKYVYGFTATPKRYDSQDKKMYFQLGPVRYKFSARDRAAEQDIDHLVYPRFTDTVNAGKDTNNYNDLLKVIMDDTIRDELICKDITLCIERKRTPIILTKRVDHAQRLYSLLKDHADHVILMSGRLSRKESAELLEERKNIKEDESVILIATGSKAGEGFNFPRLDTLMLAAPVSWEGSVEQFAGRLNRDYPGKKNAIIYDYVDSGIPVFERMYRKRLQVYKQIGFEVCTFTEKNTLEKGSFYDGKSCLPHFIDDVRNARKNAVIFSSYLSGSVLKQFVTELKDILHEGIHIHVVTTAAEAMEDDFVLDQSRKIAYLQSSGIDVSLVDNRNTDMNYAVIDREIIWYGNTGILTKGDEDAYMIRLTDPSAASGLLKKGMTKAKGIKNQHTLQIRMDV